MIKFNADSFEGFLKKAGTSSTPAKSPEVVPRKETSKRDAETAKVVEARQGSDANKRHQTAAPSKDVVPRDSSAKEAQKKTPPTPGREISKDALVILGESFNPSATVTDEETASRWMDSIILPRDREVPKGRTSKDVREDLGWHVAQASLLLNHLASKEADAAIVKRGLLKYKEKALSLEKTHNEERRKWGEEKQRLFEKTKDALKRAKEAEALQHSAEATLKYERDLMRSEKEGHQAAVAEAMKKGREDFLSSPEYQTGLFEHGLGAYNVAINHAIARLAEEKVEAPFMAELLKINPNSFLADDNTGAEGEEASEIPPPVNN